MTVGRNITLTNKLVELESIRREEGWCVMAASLGVSCGQLLAGKNMSTEAENIAGIHHQATIGQDAAD
jgi:hypothetical protein